MSRPRSAWPAVVLASVLLLPTLYVASIGPTGRIFFEPTGDDDYVAYPAWEAAYSPILWANDRSDHISFCMERYLRFCGARDAAATVWARRFRRNHLPPLHSAN